MATWLLAVSTTPAPSAARPAPTTTLCKSPSPATPEFLFIAPPPSLSLRDRGLAAAHGLAHVEAFELRMIKIERLVLPGILVGLAKRLRPGPGLECRPAPP